MRRWGNLSTMVCALLFCGALLGSAAPASAAVWPLDSSGFMRWGGGGGGS